MSDTLNINQLLKNEAQDSIVIVKNNQWDEGEEFIDGNENNQYDSADVVYAHDGTYAIFDTDDSKNERAHEQGIVSGEITDSIYVMVYNNGLESDKTQILSDDVNGVYETEQSWTHYNKEEGVWVPNFTNVDLDGDGIE